MVLISPDQLRPVPIVAEEMYQAFLRMDLRWEAQKLPIIEMGNRLIQDGGELLSSAPTPDNLISWLEDQRHANNVNEQRRKIQSLRSVVTPMESDHRKSEEIVADFCTNFLEIKGMAPLVIKELGIREKIVQNKPQTIWEVLCSCPQMFT